VKETVAERQLPSWYTTENSGEARFGDLVTLKPLRGRIIVHIDRFEYKGTIVIPETAKRKPTVGKVIAIGEGVTQVKIGDSVVYGLYSGTALKFKDVPYARVLTEDEIYCTKEGTAELEDVLA
jgi:chaperonin GroES